MPQRRVADWTDVITIPTLAGIIDSSSYVYILSRASEITFYGGSFITDETGAILAEASSDRPEIITARFDLTALRERRAGWGLFRDRRPELYGDLSRY